MALYIARVVQNGEEAEFLPIEGKDLDNLRDDYGDGDFRKLTKAEVFTIEVTPQQEQIYQAMLSIQSATDCPQAIEDLFVALFESGYNLGRKHL